MADTDHIQDALAAARCEILHGDQRFVFYHDDPDDHIFRVLKNSGAFYERDLLEPLASVLHKGDFVVDVGANIGNHTVFLAGVCSCRVLAIEPNPDALNLLRINVEANLLGQAVEIVGVAAGASTTTGAVISGSHQHNLGAVAIAPTLEGPISIQTLDSVLAGRRPDVIKIDTEGSEHAILIGAARTIEKHRPIICLESPSSAAFGPIHRFLTARGYALAGVCNHTPTFTFVHTGNRDVGALLRALSEFAAHSYLNARSDVLSVRDTVQKSTAALSQVQRTVNAQSIKSDGIAASLTAARQDVLARLGSLEKSLAEALNASAETRSSVLDRIIPLLISLGDDLNQIRLAERVARRDGAGAVETLVRPLSGRIDSVGDAILEQVSARAEDTVRRIAAQLDEHARQLAKDVDVGSAARADRLLSAFEAELAPVRGLVDAVDSLTGTIGASSRQHADELSALREAVSEAPSPAALLETAVRHLDERLSTTEQAVSVRIAGDIASLTEGLLARIDGKIDLAVRGLAEGVAETLADAVVGVEQRLEGVAEHLLELHKQHTAGPHPTAAKVEAARAPQRVPVVPHVPTPLRPPVTGEERASFAFASGWHGWRHHQAAKLEAGGAVVIDQDRSTPGIVSPPISLPGGGLFRVTVTVKGCDPADACLALMVSDGGDERLGPVVDLHNGLNEKVCFTSRRTERVQLFIVVQRPRAGVRFQVDSARVEALDPESYYAAERAGRTQPVVASLATIPSRTVMLRDCVDSLLVQCDRVRVFLNKYPAVPDFLDHPRVEVRVSQDWDDKGDAGKFFWVDEAADPGYRLILDDDLLFPPDFASVMSAKVASYNNRAFVALHGILLKQPVTRYYDPDSRSAFHFESQLAADRTVHVLGTNALCYHSGALRMRWDDFMHRNMADIFLARYAQENRLPMVAAARPRHWVRQNSQPGGFETIYQHSLNQTRSRFDSSAVQDAIVKFIAPLTLQPTHRPKLVACVCFTAADRIQGFLNWWRQKRPAEADRVLVLADASPSGTVADELGRTKLDEELHIVRGDTPAAALTATLDLARRIGGDNVLVLTDGVRLPDDDWYSRLVVAKKTSGSSLVGLAATAGLRRGREVLAEDTTVWFGRPLPVASSEPVRTPEEALAALFGPESLAPPEPARTDASASAALPAGVLEQAPALGSLLAGGAEAAPARDAGRLPGPPCPPLSINELFERVVLLNLDRRPDRLAAALRRLERAGVNAKRFRAVDGTWAEVRAEYMEYLRTPIVAQPAGARRIASSFEYYNDYDSQAARVAFVEHRDRCKAIRSPGAWGYLRSMEQILDEALKDRVDSLLVLDDDVVFHRRSRELFAAAVALLPEDWLALQLGTLQYHWDERWMSWADPLLYRSRGAAVGSHAVGVRFDLLPFLLEQTRRRELPYDTGALSAALHAFPDRNYVVYPNIAIQAIGESDIQSSDFQKSSSADAIAGTYRWTLANYDR